MKIRNAVKHINYYLNAFNDNDIIKYVRMLIFPKSFSYAIQIETTNICNARCVFCPNPTLKREKKVMSDEDFLLIIKKIKEERISVMRFILHINGEPLTDTKIFDRVRLLKKEFPNAAVRFTTNFSLANEEKIDEILACGLDEITISLNSVDSNEYKEIMSLSYENTIHNIELLKKKIKEKKSNIVVNVSIVAREDNKECVKEFIEKWSKDFNVRVIKLGKWVGFEEKIDNRNDEKKGVCNILYNTINILSNGDLALCCFDAEGVIHRNINTDKIMDSYRGGGI